MRRGGDLLMNSKVRLFCKQWGESERVKRGERNDLTGAEVVLLLLFEEWAAQYDLYEAENEQYRKGKLAGQPVHELPKL